MTVSLIVCGFTFNAHSQSLGSLFKKRIKKEDRVENVYLPKFTANNVSKFKEKWGHIENSLEYTKDDIKFIIIRGNDTKSKLVNYHYTNAQYGGYVIRDEQNNIIDTVLTHTYVHDGISRFVQSELKEKISMSEYVAEKLQEQQDYVDSETLRLSDILERSQIVDKRELDARREAERARFVSDSIKRAEDEYYRKLNEENKQRAELEKFQERLAKVNFQFYEPTSEIKQKTYTNKVGATVSYSFYMKDGKEVRHGKFSIKGVFNDYMFYTNTHHGYAHVTGTESYECTYRNGLIHGKVVYKRDLKYDTTFHSAGDRADKVSVSFDVYKNFLDGEFDFQNGGVRITGNAHNGFLGKITFTNFSDSDSATVESAVDGDASKPYMYQLLDSKWSESGIHVGEFFIDGVLIHPGSILLPYELSGKNN